MIFSPCEVQKIYTGKITNWKEVGGEDIDILPYQREKNSVREKVTLIESVYDHYLAMFAEIQFEDEAERIDIIKSVKKELDNLVDEIKSNKI